MEETGAYKCPDEYAGERWSGPVVVGIRQKPGRRRHYRKGRYIRRLVMLLLCAVAIKGIYNAGEAAGNGTVLTAQEYAEVTEVETAWEPEYHTSGGDDSDIVFDYAFFSDLVGDTAASGSGEKEQISDSGYGDALTSAQGLTVKVSGSRASLGEVNIDNYTSKTVDLEQISTQLQSIDENVDGPLVLIVHTHTSEAYTPSGNDVYEASDVSRTEDSDYNMVRVGDEIAAILNDCGIETIHDTTLHDYPSYTGAYGRSLETVEKYLQEYPSIQVVLDVHRDAVQLADGTMFSTAAKLSGGEKSAQVMLVVGTDDTGLEHPNWQQNLAFAVKMQQALLTQGDSYARDINLSSNRYNQQLTPFSLIVEVGSSGNTLQEALACARVFAATAAQVIKEL